MKTKLHLVFLMLLAAYSSCDKPILIEDNQSVTQIKSVANPGIVVVDGYTIKPSSNQIIVKFDSGLSQVQRQNIRNQYFLTSPPKACSCGDSNIELWTIDNTQIEIEEGVKKLNSGQSGSGVEGDRGFEIKVNSFPGYQPSNPVASFKSLIRNSTEGTITIAVIDTGLDFLRYPTYIYEYPNLQNCNGATSGWNFINNSDNIMDDQGHGTAVTSIITTKLNSGNVDFRILPLKVLNDQGYGTYWDVVCAFGYIKEIQDQGGKIDIINTSFGGAMSDVKAQLILTSIISDISNKSVIIASAGNDGVNTDNNANDHFLSSYTSSNLLAVGGYKLNSPNVGINPSNIVLHENSNYGKVSIDITAPYVTDYILNANELYSLNGTSYSTALVTGFAGKLAANSQYRTNLLLQQIKRSAISAPNLNSQIGGKRALITD